MVKDYNELTPEEIALYDKYDAVVNTTILNLYSLGKKNKKLYLTNFDLKNKEHLFFIRVALVARDLHGYDLQVKCGLWQWIVLNWKLRRLSRRIPRTKDDTFLIEPNIVLNYMRGNCEEYVGGFFNFGDIYDAFYEGDIR